MENSSFTKSGIPKCRICKDRHFLKNCPTFQRMTVSERRDVIREKGFCFNCLCTAHKRNWCPSRNKCMVCRLNHHTMVHMDKLDSPKTSHQHRLKSSKKSPDPTERYGSGSRSQNYKERNQTQRRAQSKPSSTFGRPRTHFKERLSNKARAHIFLPTALARVQTSTDPEKARLLLNSGEAQTVILKTLVDRLHLRTTRRDNKEYCTLNLESYYDAQAKIQIVGLVQKSFRTTLPSITDTPKLQSIYNHLTNLADPHFYKPSNVEIILANDNIPKILRAGMIQTSSNMPIAQSTIFGWTISGACQY
ncbi:uncharacterized protein LOC131995837 [Stomoxys calcitrans]|uniref:uncharacterized protein LOC131994184 n=1 Tax=Stomoxys calcitrans TaxID=35570 RepID=UPI0027E37314|nr:uncharacterized protein LOC131994184 [Stomoxys calcitrans]XP_059216705.1 uncharacterized protein LOC131994201 [Stomoxys calcitrans]XP_059219179.1 uncharacterized protein LOC131995142 [Stomoxys calcitrans]XP_059219448.1 uncharacterized protein LOC131995203 [Stomoxys calcitrans]XP_059220994.1 uncharacterized protein LOC131995837 [Stomoxys calcitrans]